MKNLKKVLALVLVVATVFSFTSMASAKFTDDSKIAYNEAVDVMSAVGVINGFTDNSFKPADSVTRAQMAKMVAYIMSSGEDVGNLYASANTFTDCNSHWAKGYIAYASKTGVVAGTGKGKFDPEGSVTGVQAAKMLLVALGYKATNEGLTGTNWSVNTMALAKKAGLLKDLAKNMDYSKALTREQSALMMFNALQADMVEYTVAGSTIIVGGVEITTGGSTASKITNEKASDYRKTAEKQDLVMQLCEMYFGDLTKTNTASNKFGAAAHAWKFAKGDEMVYADKPILTYTTTVTGKELFKDVKDAGYLMEATGKLDTVALAVYRNGSTKTTETIVNNTAKHGGNGIEINIYEGTGKVVRATIAVTYLAEVKSITKDKTTTTADERALTVDVIDGKTGIKLNADKTTGFDSIYADVKVGDMVLVTPEKDNTTALFALSVAIPETVTGKITNVNTSNKTLICAGTTYNMSQMVDVKNFSASKDDVKVFIDANGYAVGSTAIGKTGDKSLAVLKSFQGLNADGALVPKANVVMSDGIAKTVEVAADAKIGVYTYAEKDGVYTLTALDTTAADGATLTFTTQTVLSGAKKITTNAGPLYFTADVKFVYVDGGKAVVKEGVQKITTAASGAVVVKETSTGVYQAAVVYVLAAAESGSTTSDELIYLAGSTTGATVIEDKNESSGYKTYYTYNAYINGVKVENFYATTDSATAGFYKNEKNEAGAYVVTSGNAYTTATGKTAVTVADMTYATLVNGTIMTFTDDVTKDYDVSKAVVTDLSDNEIDSANAIKAAADENVVKVRMIFNADDMTVNQIYVVSVVAKP